MKGYKLVEVEGRPAEIWAQLKTSVNNLADHICEVITNNCRDAETVSGQRVPRIEITKGEFVIKAQRNAPLTPTEKATWRPLHIQHKEGWDKTLPDRPPKGEETNPFWSHWNIRASQVRMILEMLMTITQEDVLKAIDEELEDEK
jgi:hypothetical protein